MSEGEAASFLSHYHLRPTDIAGVFERLGTVQYDPLNPVGRNPDLVLQARVPGYRVDDWQKHAYTDRLAYDAWDKQACLVPTSDWPLRALIRDRYHPWDDHRVLDAHPEAVQAALDEIDRKGPLSSLEFDDRSRIVDDHSWLGPRRIKRILRALWARGALVTHHRESGRHYYDRPERVIPAEHLAAAQLAEEGDYHRWIVLRRHRAAGLLRLKSNPEIWSVCGDSTTRSKAIEELVAMGELTKVHVGTRKTLFHAPTVALSYLNRESPEPRVTFLAPLDNLLWDRRAIKTLFDFDYSWEVYRPIAKRRWGYYVLPVLYGSRFVARLDSRLDGKTWRIARWWWEEHVKPDLELLDALRTAADRFATYLAAEDICVDQSVDAPTRSALVGGVCNAEARETSA
jgi:uncharacterized protein